MRSGVRVESAAPCFANNANGLEDLRSPPGNRLERLAKEISVPARRINEIVHGTRAISAESALRLARYFGTSDEFWLNLQMRYELEGERDRLGPRLRKEVAVLKRAS